MNIADPAAAAPEGTTQTQPDICVVMNPSSGRKDADTEARLRAEFDRYPGRFVLRIVPAGITIAEEAERAIADDFPTVVAAGGDGTICAVAAVLAGTGRRLGILPMGTFNYFARGLGLPEDLSAAVDLIATGEAHPICVGDVNGRVFLNNASLGLYPAILQTRETTYSHWGRSRLAAHWSVLVTFLNFYHPLALTVTVDGVPLRTRTPLAFVARSAYQLDLFDLEGADCIRNHRFALFLAPDVNRWQLLFYALRLAWGRMEAGRDFELICGDDIVIETRRRRRLLARDGERERLSSPFRFRIRKDALCVIAPDAL